MIYAPLSNKVQTKSTLLAEKIQTLEWMQQVQANGNLGKTQKTIDNNQLLTLIATELKKSETLNFPYQLQQAASGDIQLSFEEIPFNLFMSWLMTLSKQYKISIKQLQVDPTKTPGVTKLMMVLSAGS